MRRKCWQYYMHLKNGDLAEWEDSSKMRIRKHFFCAISIIQPYWINEARDEWEKDKEVWPRIQKLQKIPIQTTLPEIEEEGKIMLEPGAVT